MFELDYLTQRLTFTRGAGTGAPDLIGGYAPTFEGDVAELPVATGRAAAPPSWTRSCAVVREGGRPDRRRRGRPVGRRPRQRAARGRRRAPADRPVRSRRAADRRMTVTRPRPPRPLPACSAARSSCRPDACRHDRPARRLALDAASPAPSGTVAVVGAGKMGLPLAAQFAEPRLARHRRRRPGRRWSRPSTRVARTSTEEPGLAERVAEAHAAGRLRATLDGAAAAREADVVVMIVPVMLDDEQQPDYR